MRIGLIDVDGKGFPNLALMKIAAWHRGLGDAVEWWWTDFTHYDTVYMAKVFSNEYTKDIPEPMNADRVVKGGTGYAISLQDGKEVFDIVKHQELPPEIETQFPDYSIYPYYKFAVSMTTRGCPRGCPFCHIRRKEGLRTRKVADVGDYWNGQSEIKVLDANLTACPDKEELFEQYRDTGAEIDFTQGLDIRLLTEADIAIINGMRIKRMHFAWDNPKEDLTEDFRRYARLTKKVPKGYNGMVYVLTNYGSTIEEDLWRIETLKSMKYDPYVMIYDKPHAPQRIRDLQRWCNNKWIFKSCDFKDYRRS